MKFYVIAGEASGDLHAANLMKEIRKQNADTEFRCWGGDRMESAGGKLVKHYKDLAFMGFIEVIANLRIILRNIAFCKKDLLEYQPDAIILVDYPGFNMRIARFAKENGIKVIYYISPQVWAWKQSRVHQLKRDVDLMMVILPFEKEFYQKFSMDVEFVGHPLLDAIKEYKIENDNSKQVNWRKQNKLDDRPIIAVIPGSRKQEISTMLPIMLQMQDHFPEHQFVIAGAPSLPKDFYWQFIKKGTGIVFNETYELFSNSVAAMVTSGTATLEAALFGVPEVVCYKGNIVSYYIARKLIKVDYISLVNLIMEREIIRELIQAELNENNLKTELSKILQNNDSRTELENNYAALAQKLGGSGASKNAATRVLEVVS